MHAFTAAGCVTLAMDVAFGSQLELENERLSKPTNHQIIPLRTTTTAEQTPKPTTLKASHTMAPKKISTNPSPSAIPPSATKATTVVPSSAGQPTRSVNKPATSSSGNVRSAQDLQEIGVGMWNKYVDETPQRVKLLDAFLVFLIAVGVLQFVYCVIAGNFVSIPSRSCGSFFDWVRLERVERHLVVAFRAILSVSDVTWKYVC